MTNNDLDVLARTIWGEARGEPQEGRVAVARVILNRFNSKKWFGAKTIAATCQKPWQFSCWNVNDPNRAKMLALSDEDPLFQACQEAARSAEAGEGPDWLKDCTHYHTASVSPNWAKGQKPVGRIGAHLFYRNIN
jgi:N-acetylmuramoyl-L-alanine amidase